MKQIDSSIDLSDEILNYLIQKRSSNSNLKFWLRQQNTSNRLDDGYWFQGTDKYIAVGFVNRTAGNHSTRSISFIVEFDGDGKTKCRLEIIFKKEKNEQIIACYNSIVNTIGGFEKVNDKHFFKKYNSKEPIESLDEFLTTQKPKIDNIIQKLNLKDKFEIPDEKFEKILSNTLKKKSEAKISNPFKIIVANITWNSKDWKEVSEDMSGHAWVGGDNIPHESWNFDFENPRNEGDKLLGFVKFTNAPKVSGNNNLFIFYSQGKIVGFYGKTEVLKDWVDINERESYNLIADKNLSVVLPNKIDNIKDKGYLEGLSRVGQVGFSYLKKPETVLNILDEAIDLNPNISNKLQNIKAWITEQNSSTERETAITIGMDKKIDLNQIFFGPPGTGKTYHTINEAIKIVDPKFYQANKDNRDKLKDRFKLLLLNNDNEDIGQIGFTTFHQSFSYEDFIEGIKPVEPSDGDTYLKYEVQEGVFKKICRLANDSLNAVSIDSDSLISLSPEEYEKAHFYKMSLGNTLIEDDNEIFDYCVDNNCITLGFGNGLNFTGKDEKELRTFGQENNLEPFPIQAMNLFSNYLKIGNYVVISNGNHYIRAIGKVVGNYEFREESPFTNNLDYKHFRQVEWVFTNKKISAKEIYNKNLSQQTIYKLEKKEIKQDFFVKEKKVDTLKLPKNPKNFVLIVDEINRGNVSSIFGELITLIEKDKRANSDEELSVTLPYSKTEFKVPNNVFIIGTMNTADRSIEALDTALRRRFSFREMPPKPNLILTEGKLKSTKGMIEDINVVKILETINNRIEKLIDKDHKIGHSYFLNIATEDELKNTFNDKVIPLLEEYFFGDFGKISLILGSSFITKGTKAGMTFAKSNEYDPSIANDLLERSVYEVTSTDDWNFKAIYE
ncbi:McrB family protein [Gaetbulibacter saemankumensis]|uniref:McrB family protein n=1 Tax=Gaetbulibacter saemankumensis TaxID=311208 RepID=UPI00040274E7|nr:AAA family ATPase [Gaetbulibacter saemankumensis]